MGALVLHKVPDCPQIQNTNIIWVPKGAHIKLIRDALFPEPLKCRRKQTPSGFPIGALMERVAHFQSLL